MDPEQYRRSCCIPPSEEEWAEFVFRFRDLWRPSDGIEAEDSMRGGQLLKGEMGMIQAQTTPR